MKNYQETSVEELVAIGKESRERLLQFMINAQSAAGKDNELHPDFMDTLFDALEELGWDQNTFVKEWTDRG